MITEWRVLSVDEHGDIIHAADGFLTERDALACMNEASDDEIEADAVLVTVEGMRDYVSGRRAFKRSGVVRVKNESIPASVRATWEVRDAHWYESGDEPDFHVR